MPLFLYEACFSRPISHGLVLQRALATLVAYGAVERVVYKQELEDPVLGLFHLGAVGHSLHTRSDFDEAGGLQA